MTEKFLSLDESAKHCLSMAAELQRNLSPIMMEFRRCKEMKESVFTKDDLLAIESGGNHDLTFSYADTRVRFSLVVGLRDASPAGVIVVTHEYELLGKRTATRLGEFNVDPRGRTNFTEHNGKSYFVHEAADLIVAHYLAKAFENNLKVSLN